MSNIIVAIIAGLPAIISAVGAVLNGRRLKRTSDRIKDIHAALPNGSNGAFPRN